MKRQTSTKWVGRVFGLAVFNALFLTILGITGRTGSNPELLLFFYVMVTAALAFLD